MLLFKRLMILKYHVRCVKEKCSKFEHFYLYFNFSVCNSLNSEFSVFLRDKNQLSPFPYVLASRLNLFKMKTTKLLLRRLNSELILHVEKVVNLKGIYTYLKEDAQIWSYVFQIEAIRSYQYGKVVSSFDFIYTIPGSQITFIRSKSLFNYRQYSFRIYFQKIRLFLSHILSSQVWEIHNSLLPLDLKISNQITEMVKLFSFFYISFNSFKIFSKKMDINIAKRRTKFFNKLYNKGFKSLRPVNYFIFPLVPVRYFYDRFRSLGFVHFSKFRPIGNVRYLHFSDLVIIKMFGYLAFSFLFWFKLSENFSSVKVFVELLRNSCLLTLCRKHNKHKDWVYAVYTSNV